MSATAERGTPCTLQSRAVGEPMAGTAPIARGWIVLEHAGPWGRYAVDESDLPEPVRAHLAGAKDRGITVLLARRPERRASRPEPGGGLRAWVARCGSGGARLRTGLLADSREVLAWDLDAIAEGSLPALDRADPDPLVLVCTNGRRDVCCAVHGRALLAGLAERASTEQWGRVWECSHVGGHRFAPTLVTLPDGMVHGRVSIEAGLDLLDRLADGRIAPDLLRGRSCLPSPLQAAEIAVRAVEGIDTVADLDTLAVIDDRAVPVPCNWPVADEPVLAEVRHLDGRAWTVTVGKAAGSSTPDGDLVARAESCGGTPKPVTSWLADSPVPAAPWH